MGVKIKVLRRYRRSSKHFSLALKTCQAPLRSRICSRPSSCGDTPTSNPLRSC